VTRIVSPPSLLALLACLIASGSVNADIAWQSQLKVAHTQAQKEGKLLLLHFYDDNCVWCDRLEKGAFQSPEVVAAIQSNYVPVKIHASQNPPIASTFKVTRFPTDVIVTTQGQALSHTVSPQDPSRYVAMLTQYAQPGAGGTQIAAAPAAPGQPTPAMSSDQGPTVTATPQIQASATGFAMPASTGVPASTVSVRSSNSVAPLPTKTPKGVKQASELELAMDGYCAVTVIDEDRWVEGNPEFGVVHLGRLYLFSSKDSMDRFLANPEPYTPVLNGIDVVRFFEERKIVQGNRDWGLKDPDHNRMFFFADEAALNHFYNQHTRYTDAALTVMEKAVKDANPQ